MLRPKHGQEKNLKHCGWDQLSSRAFSGSTSKNKMFGVPFLRKTFGTAMYSLLLRNRASKGRSFSVFQILCAVVQSTGVPLLVFDESTGKYIVPEESLAYLRSLQAPLSRVEYQNHAAEPPPSGAPLWYTEMPGPPGSALSHGGRSLHR